LFPQNKTEVAFTTDTVYSSMLSPLTTDEQGNQPIIKRDAVMYSTKYLPLYSSYA